MTSLKTILIVTVITFVRLSSVVAHFAADDSTANSNIATVAPANPASTNQTQPSTATNRTTTNSTDYHDLMLSAVNAERTSRGLGALCMNTKLQTAAQAHSIDMANKNYMGHVGSDNSTMVNRIDAVGFQWTSIAENVAGGQTTVKAVMAAWMKSPGHRANILNPRYKMFGTGFATNSTSRYKSYWTQNFGAGSTEVCS